MSNINLGENSGGCLIQPRKSRVDAREIDPQGRVQKPKNAYCFGAARAGIEYARMSSAIPSTATKIMLAEMRWYLHNSKVYDMRERIHAGSNAMSASSAMVAQATEVAAAAQRRSAHAQFERLISEVSYDGIVVLFRKAGINCV